MSGNRQPAPDPKRPADTRPPNKPPAVPPAKPTPARFAFDDPAVLARAAAIVRTALARRALAQARAA